MCFIKTFTGRQLDLLAPKQEQIDLEDIAHGLAMKCRWNGQTNQFYSVAEHSMRVAYLLLEMYQNPLLAMAGLMHDAAEAYLPDLATPLKKVIKGFDEIESALMLAITQKFNLPPVSVTKFKVKLADRVLLVTEGRDLMAWDLSEAWCQDFPPPIEIEIVPLPWAHAKKLFLKTYNHLQQQIKNFEAESVEMEQVA
ncbi:HD domain-containing protein [Adhaeribacter swui]|uniref:HD domain-containing protein n=1 Tax=Adhaeribacter swui TaxID=2086471 RepID=A0A7G7GB02_9BACT|nr:HD domain-containing protein [Adhaeribacter swui]QNF34336.1 HD domain-containing protein [Adhaeribacter swui]